MTGELYDALIELLHTIPRRDVAITLDRDRAQLIVTVSHVEAIELAEFDEILTDEGSFQGDITQVRIENWQLSDAEVIDRYIRGVSESGDAEELPPVERP